MKYVNEEQILFTCYVFTFNRSMNKTRKKCLQSYCMPPKIMSRFSKPSAFVLARALAIKRLHLIRVIGKAHV